MAGARSGGASERAAGWCHIGGLGCERERAAGSEERAAAAMSRTHPCGAPTGTRRRARRGGPPHPRGRARRASPTSRGSSEVWNSPVASCSWSSPSPMPPPPALPRRAARRLAARLRLRPQVLRGMELAGLLRACVSAPSSFEVWSSPAASCSWSSPVVYTPSTESQDCLFPLLPYPFLQLKLRTAKSRRSAARAAPATAAARAATTARLLRACCCRSRCRRRQSPPRLLLSL